MHNDQAGNGAEPSDERQHLRGLLPRIVSGSILGLITLGSLYAGPKPFSLWVLIIVLFMSWEWGRVVRGHKLDSSFLVHAIVVCAATVLAAVGQPAFGLITLIIGAILVLTLNLGESGRVSAAGVFYVGLPAICLIWLRASVPEGFAAVLLLLAIVSASDIAAFAAGKMVGGFKLWPSVSPNKTWSGLISAMLAGGLVGAVASYFIQGTSAVYLTVIALLLGLTAQLGDLAESALKRGFGVKDTSDLIPGHGGFMDRMDGVVAVALVAGLLALAINYKAPAHAILYGI